MNQPVDYAKSRDKAANESTGNYSWIPGGQTIQFHHELGSILITQVPLKQLTEDQRSELHLRLHSLLREFWREGE